VIAGSIASLYLRAMMKKEENDPIVFSIVFQFTLSIIVSIFALYKGFIFPPFATLWPNFLFSGALYALGVVCNFRASKYIGAGEMTIITASGTLVSIALGVLLLGNPFGLVKSLGTVLILSSTFILYGKERMKINKGVWFALVSALCYGVAVVNDSYILRSYNAISFVPMMTIILGLIIAITNIKSLKKVKTIFQPRSMQHIFLYSLFYAVAAISFYLSLESGAPVSQMSPISRASIIVTVILATIFLKERKGLLEKSISAVFVTIGVLLMA